jgi:hypothetical protein
VRPVHEVTEKPQPVSDTWFEINGTGERGGAMEVRPGVDDGTVTIRSRGLTDPDVPIEQLRSALEWVEEEHQR